MRWTDEDPIYTKSVQNVKNDEEEDVETNWTKGSLSNVNKLILLIHYFRRSKLAATLFSTLLRHPWSLMSEPDVSQTLTQQPYPWERKEGERKQKDRKLSESKNPFLPVLHLFSLSSFSFHFFSHSTFFSFHTFPIFLVSKKFEIKSTLRDQQCFHPP